MLFTTLVSDIPSTLEILEKVNSFYSNAWNMLITFVIISGSLVGFIIPYILRLFEKKKANEQLKVLDDKINNKLTDIEQLNAQLTKKLIEQKIEYTKQTTVLAGSILHVQAMTSDVPKVVIRSSLQAIKKYLDGEDYSNILGALYLLEDYIHDLGDDDVEFTKTQSIIFSELSARLCDSPEYINVTEILDNVSGLFALKIKEADVVKYLE